MTLIKLQETWTCLELNGIVSNCINCLKLKLGPTNIYVQLNDKNMVSNNGLSAGVRDKGSWKGKKQK